MTPASLRLATLATSLVVTACAVALPTARTLPTPPPHAMSPKPASPLAPLFHAAVRRGLPPDGILLVTAIDAQTVTVLDAHGVRGSFRVSTALAGVGNRQNSNQTPLGWHRIDGRFGGDEPPGRVFVSRVPQAQRLAPHQWNDPGNGDFVLTRILWLQGLEPGVNAGPGVDSRDRHIYLHGTNQEHLLGQPASHGCIRLSNRDIMELFDWTEGREAWCLVTPSLADPSRGTTAR